MNAPYKATKTAIDYPPAATSLDTTGIGINEADQQTISLIDDDCSQEVVPRIRVHYSAFCHRLPNELTTALGVLQSLISLT